jgi:poly-gamma-glutamate biosynthesis protein PgsC/CapC
VTVELTPEIAALSLAIGLLFSLVCYLITNLSPGGMITPGWLALTLVQEPRRAAIVVCVTALTFLGTLGLQKVVILYGKRLFAAVVLVAVFLQTTLFFFIQTQSPFLFAHQTLGFIVPGLIAYQLVRQPIAPTLISTAAVTLLNYVVLTSGLLLGLMPTL